MKFDLLILDYYYLEHVLVVFLIENTLFYVSN